MWRVLGLLAFMGSAMAVEWSVPLAGNVYRSSPGPGRVALGEEGLQWRDAGEVYSVFVHLDRPAELKVALEGKLPAQGSGWRVAVRDQVFEIAGKPDAGEMHELGRVEVTQPGYLRLDLSGTGASGAGFGQVKALRISSDTADLKPSFVKSNDGNMFYWGRRGPSVHLGYDLPEGRDIEWAYSEITVPEGQDPIGSYFMANGFGEGYFGIQVKSPVERWVLFSVWSPFHTDRPAEIPEAYRIVTLATGPGVKSQNFGGEGSGGQSFLIYPWVAGKTYRFLTRVQPHDDNTTTYTSWFGDKAADEWRLMASFRRPRTKTHLRGFHSFLENFAPDYGAVERSSDHGSPWVCDTSGQWHEITRARFTADGTAGGGHRLDYAGGVRGGRFFMKNGGFFSDRVPFNQSFEIPSNPATRPLIDFAKLPMK
ncbi:MAG: DUF3472 domain-containing protein [Akkermansiaceae bacterium]|nr:DUF3472 domain-containing protein [Akkermansiaceae bacterium]